MCSVSDLKLISPQTLRQWFEGGSSSGNGKFAVVDVRDRDYIGGHIKGCYHYPADQIEDFLPELSDKLKEAEVKDVVFHCMLSQLRGPKSALQFLRFLRNTTEPQERQIFEGMNVWVLKGGFSRWALFYGEDPRVTEDYAIDLWT